MAVVGGETGFFVYDYGFEVFEPVEAFVAQVWGLVFRSESYEGYDCFEFERGVPAEIPVRYMIGVDERGSWRWMMMMDVPSPVV